MTRGTDIGAHMMARARVATWGNPMWDIKDVGAGAVMPGEAQLLYGLVRALRPETILEVGTSHGYSTLHLAQACKDNAKGHIHTVEIDRDRRASASQNLVDAELYGFVDFCRDIPDLDRVDFAFLDAEHTADALREYLPYCKNAPVIAIHDATWQGHVREVVPAGYHCVILDTSHSGMAILTRE